MELNDILKVALQSVASDIHIKAGMPPIFRIDGQLRPLKDAPRLTPEEIGRMSQSIMNNWQKDAFKTSNELDLAYGVPGLGRFRVNVFTQRGAIGMVLRVIPFKIMTVEQLNLPPVISQIAMEERGLILCTGTTGSGKSTTLAAIVDFINTHRTCHIMTIEDPIEFLIRDKRSIINQREVGSDTRNFSAALRSALRQDPDVILVGEMRDMETIETALVASETGHLVMSTVHTLDATETINRIVAIFPPHQQKQIRLQLATVLKSVISQRLVPRSDGKGRVPACEILINNAQVTELIEDKERTKEIADAIRKGYQAYGMQSFDQSLMFLMQQNFITYEDALKYASNREDFALRAAGISSSTDTSWEDFEQRSGAAGAGQQPAAKPGGAPKGGQGPKGQAGGGFQVERF